MHKPFAPTRWTCFRQRRRLSIGPGCALSPTSVFSINRASHIRLGAGCRVSHGAILATYGGWIELGERVSINPYTILYGHGGLRIGDDVRIAAHCVLIPANHRFDRLDLPIRCQGQDKKGITVGNDVWIGAQVTLLDGCEVGDGCVIAAGSVVRGRLEPRSVYAGVPARRIGARGTKFSCEALFSASAKDAALSQEWPAPQLEDILS